MSLLVQQRLGIWVLLKIANICLCLASFCIGCHHPGQIDFELKECVRICICVCIMHSSSVNI